jgi:histidyl-tRNA synthetase
LTKHPQFQGERVRIAFEVLDKVERQSRTETERRLSEAQFDASAIERLFEIASLKGLEAVLEELRSCPDGPAAGESLVAVTAALATMGLSEFVEVDLTVVRGLAYYTGIVFELFDRAKELRAICGGGRYDNLIREIAGIDLPCVGFGMGDVVLGELLRERQKPFEAPGQLDAFLVAVGGEDVAPVLRLAAGLRDRGIAVEYALRNQPIRKQLELAAARGAPRAVIIGPDERKAKVAVVRDLKTGKQRKVALTKVRKGVFK